MKTPPITLRGTFYGIGVALTLGLGAALSSNDKRAFLPNTSTAGHYQIEKRCELCHQPFRGVGNEACLHCHADGLQKANDSHSPAKFADPRHAASLAILDARQCRSCHHEHRPEVTRAGEVTKPPEHCFACHADIGKERPSHVRFGERGCATTGCHKYHDNTALYEDFLTRHLHDADTLPAPHVIVRTSGEPKPLPGPDAAGNLSMSTELRQSWERTAHARAGVNCSGCHALTNQSSQITWNAKPPLEFCRNCHFGEVDGFTTGRHGMRVAQQLSPMSPKLARQPMKSDANHRQLGCGSCHGAHDFDTRRAAVDSCLGCHNDPHSLAYEKSPHFRLWQKELAGAAPSGSGVSCATCHLPRERTVVAGAERVMVQHNQNANLRPNEKMLRTVCLDCHGFGFSAAALAEARLLQNNFNGHPAQSNESIAMAARRLTQNTKNKPK